MLRMVRFSSRAHWQSRVPQNAEHSPSVIIDVYSGVGLEEHESTRRSCFKRHCFNNAYQSSRWIHVSKTKAALSKKLFIFTFGSLTASCHNEHFKVNKFTKGLFIA